MIISIINNKGGTGKTTTAVNLSAALAYFDNKVLLCDLDPQASASLSLGIKYDRLHPSVFEVLFSGKPVFECIRNTSFTGLDILTGKLDLASADILLADKKGREHILINSLKNIKDYYDYIIIDCAPSLSMLQINAITACDSYIIPLLPEYLALEGLISLRDALERIKKGIGVNPHLLGILFMMQNSSFSRFFSRELREQMSIINLIRENTPKDLFNIIIKRDIKLAEAPSFGKSILEYDFEGNSSMSFLKLAQEVIQRSKLLQAGTVKK